MAAKSIAWKAQIRDANLAKMERLHQILQETASSMSLGELHGRRDNATKAYGSFQDAHTDVLNASQRPAELAAAMDSCVLADALHCKILAIIEGAVAEKAAQRPKLPSVNDIKLQKFNGDATEWVEWRSQFEEKVLNTALTAADKIDLLLHSLSGAAKNSAGKTEKRDQDELTRIWGKLVLDYDNPYKQVYSHIFAILSLSIVETPSPEVYRNMINLVEEQLRLLSKYDVASQGWGPLLCVVLLHKLDENTLYMWSTNTVKPPLPNLESLFEFLRRRIQAMEDAKYAKEAKASTTLRSLLPSNIDNQHSPQGRAPSNNRRSNPDRREEAKPYFRANKACILCGNIEHSVLGCDKFNKMDLNEKKNVVTQHRLCHKCLRENHHAAVCRSSVRQCRNCNSNNHNVVLCDKQTAPRQSN